MQDINEDARRSVVHARIPPRGQRSRLGVALIRADAPQSKWALADYARPALIDRPLKLGFAFLSCSSDAPEDH